MLQLSFVNLVPLLVIILQFFLEGAAAALKFTSKPSDPTYVVKGNDLTLDWNYNLGNDTLGFANVIKRDGNTKFIELIRTTSIPGNLTAFEPSYKGRVRGQASNSMLKVTIIGMERSDQGKYTVNVNPRVSGTLIDDVNVIVQYPANFTNVSGNQTVPEGTDVLLFCNASGSPLPNITWAKVLQDRCKVLQKLSNGTLKLDNIHSTDAGTYKCIASNGVGNRVSHTLDVAVLFPPKIEIKEEYYVGRGQTAYLYCQAVGYPQPTITWSPCSPKDVCDKSFFNITNVQTVNTSYSCEATNSEGNDSANTSLIIGGKNVYLRLMIIDEECTPKDQSFWEKLKVEVNNIFTGKNGYTGTQLLNFRCGSIIVDLVLKFNTSVAEDVVISTFRNAIQNGKLGELNINASSIEGIAPVNASTAAPPTTTPEPGGSTTWIIVLSVLAGILFLVIVAVVVARCVRMKNKKNTRVSGNGHDGAGPHGDPSRGQEVVISLDAQGDKSEERPKPTTYSEVEGPVRQEPGGIQYTDVAKTSFQTTKEAPSLHRSYYADVV